MLCFINHLREIIIINQILNYYTCMSTNHTKKIIQQKHYQSSTYWKFITDCSTWKHPMSVSVDAKEREREGSKVHSCQTCAPDVTTWARTQSTDCLCTKSCPKHEMETELFGPVSVWNSNSWTEHHVLNTTTRWYILWTTGVEVTRNRPERWVDRGRVLSIENLKRMA